jgi:nucleotide-binding universal stress UspA family protein
MLAVKQILCAVDVLKPAQAALSHAVLLAGVFRDAQLALVNVSLRPLDRLGRFSSNTRGIEQLTREQNGLEKLEVLLKGVAPNIASRSTSHVLRGKPISAILAYTRATKVDLIVLGVREKSALARLVAAGMAEQIVQGTASPVLTVRETAAVPAGIGRILLPIDFSRSTQIAFEWALALAERFGAWLTLLHVNSGTWAGERGQAYGTSFRRQQLAELAQRAHSRGTGVTTAVCAGGSTATSILQIAVSGAYDLIVMGLHPIRGGARESAASVGFSVRMRSSIPVLSVHAGYGPLALCADDLACEPALEGSMAGDARYAWPAS